jgi:hypothetical protein
MKKKKAKPLSLDAAGVSPSTLKFFFSAIQTMIPGKSQFYKYAQHKFLFRKLNQPGDFLQSWMSLLFAR